MVYIGRWTTITVIIIALLGFVFALPNVLPASGRASFPSWVPSQTISLGLDLQGGSYLLLEVDLDAVKKERLEALQGDVRAALRKAHIGYDKGPDIQGDSVVVRILDSARLDEARNLLKGIASPAGGILGLGVQEYDFNVTPDGQITMTM